VIDLVLWSFVVALTPVALGLSWRLISGVGSELSRTFEGAEQWGSLPPLGFDPPSSSISVTGRTPRPGTGRALAPNRRGSPSD
jgi:hypothetical protein